MKYVVNQRGGAKQVNDQLVFSLLASGYIEITKKQFEDKQYYPEHDQGTSYTDAPAVKTQIQAQASQAQANCTSFKTRIV